MKRRYSTVVQTHHITYFPEWTVRCFKGEHYVLTLLQRRKRVSEGLLEALSQFIYANAQSAEALK